jgi:hypothetical protein
MVREASGTTGEKARPRSPVYSTVTDLARLRGWSTSQPRGALGRRGRRTAMPPHPRAVCRETAGGAGDGGAVPLQGSGRRWDGDT